MSETEMNDEQVVQRVAVGLMSGTSLDGVDAACCTITRPSKSNDPLDLDVKIESFVTHEYQDELRGKLVTLCDEETGTVDDVCRMNVSIAEVLADLAQEAWEQAGRTADEVDLIASHGQTIWHIPENEQLPGEVGRSRSTLQIGDGSTIADRTGQITVSDFRTRDVAAGGHGAPLAPYFDVIQFADDERSRAIQNIGGIGNCTVLPAAPTIDSVQAFDTGPGNMVIDAIVELLTEGEQTYDIDGKLAADGTVSNQLVSAYLDDEYFRKEPPKSTGREYFGHRYAKSFIEDGREQGLEDKDIIASATALTARSIANAYDRFASEYPDEIYVSGGGVFNPTLMDMLETETKSPVHRLRELGVEGEQKEAALFALLGVARVVNIPNNVPSATGATKPVVMGKISQP